MENENFDFLKKFSFSKGCISWIIYSSRILFTSIIGSFFGSIFLWAIISLISDAASIPTSELIKNSSILSKVSSSISFLIMISLNPDAILFALFIGLLSGTIAALKRNTFFLLFPYHYWLFFPLTHFIWGRKKCKLYFPVPSCIDSLCCFKVPVCVAT